MGFWRTTFLALASVEHNRRLPFLIVQATHFNSTMETMMINKGKAIEFARGSFEGKHGWINNNIPATTDQMIYVIVALGHGRLYETRVFKTSVLGGEPAIAPILARGKAIKFVGGKFIRKRGWIDKNKPAMPKMVYVIVDLGNGTVQPKRVMKTSVEAMTREEEAKYVFKAAKVIKLD